jgi:hypothetical protein
VNQHRTTLILATAAVGLTIAACGSSATPAASSAPPSPTAPATAPDSDQCQAFAQVYNSQVSPILNSKPAAGDGNVYFTKLADAFTALANSLSGATDPYSQTIVKDAQAFAADPSSYTALGAFNTDLQAFLKQCGFPTS